MLLVRPTAAGDVSAKVSAPQNAVETDPGDKAARPEHRDRGESYRGNDGMFPPARQRCPNRRRCREHCKSSTASRAERVGAMGARSRGNRPLATCDASVLRSLHIAHLCSGCRPEMTAVECPANPLKVQAAELCPAVREILGAALKIFKGTTWDGRASARRLAVSRRLRRGTPRRAPRPAQRARLRSPGRRSHEKGARDPRAGCGPGAAHPHQAAACTSIFRGRSSARFGMRTVNTPSLRLASILSVSSSLLSAKLRR